MSKTVFITGASNGIGKGIAYEYASRGCDLALSARNKEKLTEIAMDIRQKHPGIQINIYPLDVSITEDILPVIKKAANDFKSIDIIIANAGIGGGGAIGSGKIADDISGSSPLSEADVELIMTSYS